MRDLVLQKFEKTHGITPLDSTSIDWLKFFWGNYSIHTLSADEIYRFYLVAEKYYDDSNYEDILLLLNNIHSIFELRAGTEIKIPAKRDVDIFLRSQND